MYELETSRSAGRAQGLAFGAALFALFVALPARGVSNRIFLSTNGNNASDCANPLTPCLTFAGALAQINTGGEVIAEATGGYGPLNITRSVTISGPPGVVIYSGLSVTINAPSAVVVLRGLTIDGTGAASNGIVVSAVGSLYVESCVITGFTGFDASHGNGIVVNSGAALFVKDTIVRQNGYIGIYINTGEVVASIEHCRLEGNTDGLVVVGASLATVRGSSATGNIGWGMAAESGGELNIENCAMSNNSFGVISNGGATVRVSNSTVTDNVVGVEWATGGILLSRSNNTVQGNDSKGAFTGTFGTD